MGYSRSEERRVGWIAGIDGEIKKGDSTDYYYKYDEASKKWLNVNKNDTTLKLNGCTTNLEGEVKKSSFNESYYVCKKMEWQDAQQIDYDTYGELCTKAKGGKIIEGKKNENNRYFCSENGWIYITIDWSWDVPTVARLNPNISYDSITDSRDGKVYKTVRVGNQVWMAENLNYFDSIQVPILKDVMRSWCFQKEDNYCKARGYTWDAALDKYICAEGRLCEFSYPVRGLCPKGWHLPEYDEWMILIDAMRGRENAGGALKSQTGWGEKGNGYDEVGFSVLPIDRYSGGTAHFWQATQFNRHNARMVYFSSWTDSVHTANNSKDEFYSIRCVKNDE